MFALKLFQLLPRFGLISGRTIRMASSKKGKGRGGDGKKEGDQTKVAMSIPAKSLNESHGEIPLTFSVLDTGVAKYRDWTLAHALQFIPDKCKSVKRRMRVVAGAILNYMLYKIKRGDGDNSDFSKLMSFVRSLPEEFYGEDTIIIDGLNRTDVLSRIDWLDLTHPIIVVGREDAVNLSLNFLRAIDEGGDRIKYLQLSAKKGKGEMDDICAMYLTLLTGGRLCTKDMIVKHFNIIKNCSKSDIRRYFISIPNSDSEVSWDSLFSFRF